MPRARDVFGLHVFDPDVERSWAGFETVPVELFVDVNDADTGRIRVSIVDVETGRPFYSSRGNVAEAKALCTAISADLDRLSDEGFAVEWSLESSDEAAR